jgi:hypothetical protein
MNPERGQTMTLSGGPAYFTRCVRCDRRVMANGVSWVADFVGQSAGHKDRPVLCSSCHREMRGKER